MQYLLTEAEYNDLKAKKHQFITSEKEELQKICTLAANHIPVAHDWSDDKTPRPWGCILDKDTNPGYCDDCPVARLCPCTRKEWSK